MKASNSFNPYIWYEKPPEGDPDDTKVTLDGDTYNALLDKIEQLEAAVKAKPVQRSQPLDELEELAERGRRGEHSEQVQIDLDNLSGRQLSQLLEEKIMNRIQNEVQIPVLTKIQEIIIQNEIKDLKSADDYVKGSFEEVKPEIYEIAKRNPTLSITEAYNLAMQKKGRSKAPSSEKDEKDPNKVLTGLPPRVKVVHGEKPGVSRSATAEGEPKTRMDAARRAMEDLKKSGGFKP